MGSARIQSADKLSLFLQTNAAARRRNEAAHENAIKTPMNPSPLATIN
jgi:hypothetical protein